MSGTVYQIHRSTDAKNYVQVPNVIARNRIPAPLRAVARLLLIYLLSHQDGYKCTRAEIERDFREGRDAINNGLKELEQAGYLVRLKRKGAGGRWEHDMLVTDDPVKNPLDTHPLNTRQRVNQLRKTSLRTDQGKQEYPQVAPSTENPATVNQAVIEDYVVEDYKKTESSEHGTTSLAPRCPDADQADHMAALCNECSKLHLASMMSLGT